MPGRFGRRSGSAGLPAALWPVAARRAFLGGMSAAAGRRICCWKRWRVSAHRGPRQLRRRPNVANDVIAGPQRGRFASASRPNRPTPERGDRVVVVVEAIKRREREAHCSCAKPKSAACGWRRGCRGPRWAKTRSVSHPTVSPAAGWAGARIAGGCATSLGILGTYTKVPGAARKRCADEFHRTPKEIAAVQARFQMAARRRNKPPPTSPLAQRRHSRSAKPWHARSA